MTLSDMAKELDVCVDTFKRKLVKLGLKDFDGAKFVPPRDFNAAYWRRPCMRCKGTDRRPKNQFICSRCKQTDYEYLWHCMKVRPTGDTSRRSSLLWLAVYPTRCSSNYPWHGELTTLYTKDMTYTHSLNVNAGSWTQKNTQRLFYLALSSQKERDTRKNLTCHLFLQFSLTIAWSTLTWAMIRFLFVLVVEDSET